MGPKPVNQWRLPVLLILATIIPTIGGIHRLSVILADGDMTLHFLPDISDNLPLLFHVVGGVGFLLLGALQILPQMRRTYRSGHRRSGQWVVRLGMLAALSGIWLTVQHPDLSSAVLYWGRIAAGCFWAFALVAGLDAHARRDSRAHAAWMIRAYALALPAGTLGFIMLPILLIFGETGNEMLFEWVQVIAWPVHLLGAEWIIRRKLRPSSPGISLERA